LVNSTALHFFLARFAKRWSLTKPNDQKQKSEAQEIGMAEQRGFEDLECYQLALQVMQEAYASQAAAAGEVQSRSSDAQVLGQRVRTSLRAMVAITTWTASASSTSHAALWPRR
jgi:hypothetical protein